MSKYILIVFIFFVPLISFAETSTTTSVRGIWTKANANNPYTGDDTCSSGYTERSFLVVATTITYCDKEVLVMSASSSSSTPIEITGTVSVDNIGFNTFAGILLMMVAFFFMAWYFKRI